ncbi:uncharacterized protein LOC128189806 [Crassostrea angulata]|uniref:uncharacterized protein LOC128189806 n=1 Tax=Magallana angulata TaxID=2784310 RepID=UPI0022B14466|nr:uncharacterized protein LOC128189806 [Crassostrea angulata]
MYENIFNDIVSRKKRKCIEEPTNWKEITKYYVFYGDIRNNTLRKFYILGKMGFITGFSIAASETYIHPHPKNPAGGTARFFAYSLWKRIPVGMFGFLSFGAYWYAWNTFFDNDSFMGVTFASQAAWVTTAGPIMKRWTNTYDFMPWAILLGFFHLFPYRQDIARRRLTQIKLSNPHHYEFDIFGNYIKPLTGINYNFDDDV